MSYVYFGRWATRSVVVVMVGRAGSGKSTLARNLCRNHGFSPLSFAGPLKSIAADVMGFTAEQLYGTQDAKERVDPRYGISARTFLQRLGCAVREHVGPETWVSAVVNTVRSAPGGRYVIDDCRFANELDALTALRQEGAMVVVVPIHADTLSSSDDGTHVSETWSREFVERAVAADPDSVVHNRMDSVHRYCRDAESWIRNRFPDALGSVEPATRTSNGPQLDSSDR